MPGSTDAAMTAWTQEQSLAERFALAVTQLNRLKGVLVRVRGRVTLGGTANDMIILHRAAGVGLDPHPAAGRSLARAGHQALPH